MLVKPLIDLLCLTPPPTKSYWIAPTRVTKPLNILDDIKDTMHYRYGTRNEGGGVGPN